MSFRIISSQVEETNDRVTLPVCMFILNIAVEQTKFICNGGSISRQKLAITLSINIYDCNSKNVKSFTQALTGIHGI